jgi:hypothetical protein
MNENSSHEHRPNPTAPWCTRINQSSTELDPNSLHRHPDTEKETCWNLKKYYYTVNVKAKAKRRDHSILTCELAFGRSLPEGHPVFGRLPSRRNRLAIQTGMEAEEVQEEYVEGKEDEDGKVSDICSVFAFCIHLAP